MKKDACVSKCVMRGCVTCESVRAPPTVLQQCVSPSGVTPRHFTLQTSRWGISRGLHIKKKSERTEHEDPTSALGRDLEDREIWCLWYLEISMSSFYMVSSVSTVLWECHRAVTLVCLSVSVVFKMFNMHTVELTHTNTHAHTADSAYVTDVHCLT